MSVTTGRGRGIGYCRPHYRPHSLLSFTVRMCKCLTRAEHTLDVGKCKCTTTTGIQDTHSATVIMTTTGQRPRANWQRCWEEQVCTRRCVQCVCSRMQRWVQQTEDMNQRSTRGNSAAVSGRLCWVYLDEHSPWSRTHTVVYKHSVRATQHNAQPLSVLVLHIRYSTVCRTWRLLCRHGSCRI